jgi:beta-galactosidase
MRNAIAIILLLGVVFTGFNACRNVDRNPRKTENFNNGWRFYLGDIPEAGSVAFDDNGWRELELPHDWAIEGDFSEDHLPEAGAEPCPAGSVGTGNHFSSINPMKGKRYSLISTASI